MSPIGIGVRLAALLATVFAAVLVFGSFGPSTPQNAQAAGGVNLTGVSCADIYFDHINVGLTQTPVVKGTAPGPLNRLVAKALSRTEPNQKNPGPNNWSVTTVSYLGPDTNGDLLPDQPPTKLDCNQKLAQANGVADKTSHKLTVQLPITSAGPYNAVAVIVNANGAVKNMLFTCQNTGEKVLVTAPTTKTPTDEGWGTIFSQKCINSGQGVGLIINWVGAAGPLKAKCIFGGNNPGGQLCNVSNTAQPNPPPLVHAGENGHMNPLTPFQMIGNKRPSAAATVSVATKNISFQTCGFSEALKAWIRTDSSVRTANQAPKGSNLGIVSLYLGTTSPQTKNDPATCLITASTVGFHSISVVWNREETTDFNYNPPVKVLGIPDDPDGNSIGTHSLSNPVVKFNPEVPDGTVEVVFFADDWDGDGCTDWDELDKTFMVNQFVPGSKDTWGRDPFNPNDCGPSQHNFTGSYSVLATAFPAAKQGNVISPAVATLTGETHVKKVGTTKAIQATVTTANTALLKNNQKLWWSTTNTQLSGWWQVETSSIITNTSVKLRKLFTPPCGLISLGIPAADTAPGKLYNVQCNGPVQKGNYFHCISSIDDPKAPAPPLQRPLTSHILCYIDSPGISDPGSAEVPSSDGNAGPPPPPPYTTADATQLNGTFDPVTQQIFFRGCFANVGGYNPDPNVGDLAPNIVVEAHLDAKSLKGFTNLFFHRTNAECAAKTPNADPPSLQVETVLAEQNDNFDSDADGCSDYIELSKTPKKGCGDDPFNPFDSDNTLTNSGSVTVTVAAADWNKPGAALLPGVFFDCATSATVVGAAVTIKAHCYTNAAALTINCEDTQGAVVIYPAPGTCAAGNTCPPANGVYGAPPIGGRCGEGSNGGGPRHDPTAAAPNNSGFGDVDSVANGGHTTLNGTIVGNNINFTGCFQSVENAIQGPSIYVTGTIGLHGGQGSVTIHTGETPANCKNGTPQPPNPAGPVLLEFAEQPQNFDHDKDNCATVDELGNAQALGGLRDPQNHWDFRSVTTGVTATSQGMKDRAVAVGDITAIVGRFGSNDALGLASPSRYSDPKNNTTIPLAPAYHPQYDTGGGLVGSAGTWNVKGPDGAVAVGDISAIVAQFGHNCPTNPIVQ